MKKRIIFLLTIIFTIIFTCKNVYAFDKNNYKYRELCATFEVAGFNSDGSIERVSCHGSFDEAKQFMKNNGANNLAIMTRVNGLTKIVDANQALVDLTEGPTQLTYYYLEDSLNSRRYTYMYNHGSYRGGDAGLLDTSFSQASSIYMAKIELSDFTGWVAQDDYEIVPITWVRAASSYTVTAKTISHNYITRLQAEPNYYSLVIGPKPTMLDEGFYYSYDGHYFYNDLSKMIVDYRNNTRKNSVNSNNPYYNYYMYLSNHTRTTYSSITIDEYIRNILGYKKNIYGFQFDGSLSGEWHTADSGTSRLYGSGTFFYYAQEKYGVNALLSLSLSRNETGNGRSYLAVVKNNGFGLDAVDSNPINGAKSYGSFPSSIMGYASKWITYGYAHPRDSRYFGPQFGNKWIGMNVQYASDAYWSENMASHYYNFDKTYGLQDYDYYQLGIITQNMTPAYSNPSTSSKWIYNYPECDDAVVIVDEVTSNGEKWYKVVSDLNIDSNYNEIYFSGNYNWNGYVYIQANKVKKINEGKNGYISPNSVTEYPNKNYEYDLYVEGGVQKPKVAVTTKDTPYYYDSSLTSKTGKTLLKDRYVMVYTVAKINNKPVAYLVTSDYFYDQKEWVSADSIKFTNTAYGQIHNNYSSNMYSWVNYNREDKEYSKISGLYEYTYFPVLEQSTVGSDTWLKVPVSLTTNDNIYGYTLKNYKDEIWIDLSTPVVENTPPTITAVNKTLIEGAAFDPKKDVTAFDQEDGNITSKIEITSNNVNTAVPGTYEVSYKVKDSSNLETTLKINITIKENKAPVINASNKQITINKPFNPLDGVEATDTEDGNITQNIKVTTNTVKTNTLGTYKVIYEVTDKNNKKTTKEIQVEVVRDRIPVINASNKKIIINSVFDPYESVTAEDPEDGNITKKIKIVTNTVDTKKIGKYKVTYQVTDTSSNKVEKTIEVEVANIGQSNGTFYFDYLDVKNNKLTLQGYQTISGMNNTLSENIKYKIIFTNVNDNSKKYEQQATRIADLTGINRPIYSADGYKYTHAWFRIEIDIDKLPLGDYTMEVEASSQAGYSKSAITNKLYNKEITGYQTTTKTVNIKNNYSDRTSNITLYVRNKEIPAKTVDSYYNQFDVWRVFEFTNNKLHLKGASYSYGMDLSANKNVERTIIFENKDNYTTYKYSLGSITNGIYNVALPETDNLDKTRAWYDSTIDISKLPKGNYKIYITTKSNLVDYHEFTDNLGRELEDKKITINGLNYQFMLNKDKGNTIELKVA